jgi:FtsP/CotA-like multicopper oxidase with cupredoxin domain
MVPEPTDLRSENGTLRVDLRFVNTRDDRGRLHFCYLDAKGNQSPTIRLHPGDWLILTIKNELHEDGDFGHVHGTHGFNQGNCANGAMDGLSTNLHFHGLTVPAVCHQDDVLNTFVAPSDAPFEYRLQVPADQPPGVYWYHPHIHGLSNLQVQGGASGALIIEGLERANSAVAGLPERVLVIRDQDLQTPNAIPNATLVMSGMPVMRDPDGDILNTGTGMGAPSKDLSVNFVPVSFPDYSPSLILMKPSQREIWRVLNASAITYLDLRALFNGVPQLLGIVSLDGAPISLSRKPINDGLVKGKSDGIIWQNHVELPPGGRADFIFQGPPAGVYGNLITQAVDTGPAGENDPVRPLANLMPTEKAPELPSTLPTVSASSPVSVSASAASPWLGDVKPARVRKLYFSEKPSDPKNPQSRTVFMMALDGEEPKPYDPNAKPSMTARLGEVEDWIIENRSQELHDFHIHQTHFLVVERDGVAVDEPYLRDTVNVGFWDGKSATYPSVRLRIDLRSPRTAGTIVYHCHLLEHEDGGMMGTLLVIPNPAATK